MRLKKYDRDADHSYAFGVFPTVELLRHRPGWVREVLLHSSGASNDGVTLIRELCQAQRIPCGLEDRLVERLAPRGDTYAVGVFARVMSPLDPAACHLALVNPSDMGNLGTVLRTMLGFGFRDLAIIRPAADIFDPRVIRASMGAFFQVRFALFDSFDGYHADFQRRLYPFMTDSVVALPDARFEPPFTLVFGSEGSGLPPSFHALGMSIAIPHDPEIDSLNLAVAVGIGLYGVSRALHISR